MQLFVVILILLLIIIVVLGLRKVETKVAEYQVRISLIEKTIEDMKQSEQLYAQLNDKQIAQIQLVLQSLTETTKKK